MPEGKKIRVGKLVTIGNLKTELGRLYRQMRNGTVSTEAGLRMANVLRIMGELTRVAEIEIRIADLEAKAGAQPEAERFAALPAPKPPFVPRAVQ